MLQYSVLDNSGNKDYSVSVLGGAFDIFWIRPTGFSKATEAGGVVIPRACVVSENQIDEMQVVSAISGAVAALETDDTEITAISYNQAENRIEVTTA